MTDQCAHMQLSRTALHLLPKRSAVWEVDRHGRPAVREVDRQGRPAVREVDRHGRPAPKQVATGRCGRQWL